jgi:hypothetical protein
MSAAAISETRALLSADQIARYEQLRGYRDPSAPERLIIIITIETVSVRV